MPIKLQKYNQKRNFEITGEPEGETQEPEGRLRYVVQHHAARRDHYDLRLEWDGALLSWAVPKIPSYNPREKRLAVQVEDHPLEYRNFEGTIPKGEYGGGVVMLWDEGYWEPQGDVEEGLRTGSLKIVIKGRRLKGKWALIRLKPKAGETKNNWLFLKERDEYAKSSEEIPIFTTSIRTGRTMTEIEEGEDEKITKNPFDHVSVQLAKLVNTIPESDEWLYELKYDGYRIVAYLEGNSVRLITRNGNDYTKRFSDIAYYFMDWADGRAMILDGEMVIMDTEGKTDFQALQNYMKNPKSQNLTYIAFDLLALDGEDLRGNPLIDRKENLEALMKDCPKNIRYSQHIKGKGKEFFQAACQANLEGIVGKKADSVYSGSRNANWIKLKCDKRQEFIIGGYTLSDKKTSGVSSILLGIYEGKEFVYAGRAGTGFTIRSMKELEAEFQSIKRETTPFKHAPEPKKNEIIIWLEPELVAEIKFAEWTEENLKECIQTNSHTKYELHYTSKWGKKIWLSIHNMPQIYGDEPGAQIIIDDITERKNLEQELTALSFTDTLTNVYNRRFFRLKLEEEIKYRQEVGGSFSLIMLDLDHFKSINDRYGHDCGDFVLTTITAELMMKIRKSDILTRWGGEEFIILLSGTAYNDALQIAENLRRCIEKIHVPDVESVSASFGVAGFCTGDTIDMIIQKADNMLYTAKSSGRNCVK